MIRIIGVRFRTAGKIYFFNPLSFEIKRGDHVIVETARGVEFGTVVAGITEVEEEKVVQPLKPVIRIATAEDVAQEAVNREKEKAAYRICLEKIHNHGMEMKLIDAEYTFDNNKVLFYFTADGRIDFRELVKDLASVFKTRIELRQIGVRDETKMVGGIGICGRPLCCYSYLSDFIPVSIKMAKEQNLSLNPAKISGVCGRLMCCLKNEEDTYEELNRRLPGIGDSVITGDGLRGEVHSVNVLRQMVKVVVDVGDEKEIKEYSVEQLHFRRKHGKKEKMDLSREELQELERLEEEEQQEQEPQEAGTRKGNSQRQGGRNRQGSRQDGGQKPLEGRSEGEQKAPGRRQETGTKASWQRADGSQPGPGKRPDVAKQADQPIQRQNVRKGRQEGAAKPLDGRRDGEQRLSVKHQDRGVKQSAKRLEQGTGQAQSPGEEQMQGAVQRQGGRNRQDNRDRNSQRPNGSGRQGRRSRYDNRNRRDTKSESKE